MSDSTIPKNHIRTYHCICTTFVLATAYDLSRLPVRAEPALDHAQILPINSANAVPESAYECSVLQNLVADRKAIVVRREDGFEKRVVFRCCRCQLIIGYELKGLDPTGSEVDDEKGVFYILPGGLFETDEMIQGKTPAQLS